MKRTLLLLLAAASSISVSAQGELPVDMNSGRPIITIPIASISSKQLSDNISLSYDASGVKVQQSSGLYGMGWDLNYGGSVRREVRSLPDDFTDGTRMGWTIINPLTNAPFGADIGNFPTTESAQYTKINGNNYVIDTEPDVFSYNFGGYSGKFFFDNSNPSAIHLSPMADLKVDIVLVPNSKAIQSFVITTNTGTQYTFGRICGEIKYTQAISSPIEFLKRNFSLYNMSLYTTPASYTAEWKLTQVKTPQGATLTYTYYQQPDGYNFNPNNPVPPPLSSNTVDTIKVAFRNNTGTGYIYKNIYSITRNNAFTFPSSITSSEGTYLKFTYDTIQYQLMSIALRDSRNSSGNLKTYAVTYNTRNGRNFLNTLTISSGCDQMPPYTFSYIQGTLPSTGSKSVDFWGYITNRTNTSKIPSVYYYPLLGPAEQIRLYPIPNYGSTNYSCIEADRTPDSTAMRIGTLNYIQYPYGGYTALQYEPHQYYDAQANQTYIGGGLRVKSVTYFDGINANSVITKNFVYTDSTGLSSGRLLSRPLFAMPVMQYKDPATGIFVNKGGDWSYLTVRTDKDLSLQETSSGSPVIYQEVKVYRPGSGYARHEFLTPGMYGSAASGSWTPTLNNFARSNTTDLAGPIYSPGAWMFANAPNPNFDHERGLVWRKREYNQTNVEVRRTRTYYQYLYKNGSSPSIYGLSYEYYPNSNSTTGSNNNTYFFGKYICLTEVAKVVQAETVTVFDEANSSRFNVSKSEYAYGSTVHRLLTQTKQTAPDGTIYSTRLIYPLDYGTIPTGTDTTSQMIKSLQDNFRNGMPIEQYSTVTKSDGIERVTGGSVMRLNNFGTTSSVLPLKQYGLITANPLVLTQTPQPQVPLFTSFYPSYVDGTLKIFKLDPHYQKASTSLSYDSYGNLQSSVGVDRMKSTTGWGYNGSVPAVTVRNADATQFAFSDFETSTGFEFGTTNGTTNTSAHTGINSFPFYSSAKLTKTLSKASVSNYRLSFWSNNASPVTFTVTLKDASGNLISNYPLSLTVPANSGTLFGFFAKLISVTNVTTSTFTIEIQAPSTSGSSLIDDVSFYPDGADVASYTYTFPYGVNAVTGGNQTAYTVYDGMGRQKFTLDTYKNIRSKNTYHFSTDPVRSLVALFFVNSTIPEGTTTFQASPNPCIDGVTYRWNLNNTGFITGSASQSFTFNTPGPHTLTLEVSHPLYATQTTYQTFTVAMNPCHVSICAAGAATVCGSTLTTKTTYSCQDLLVAPTNPTGTTFGGISLQENEQITSTEWFNTLSGQGWVSTGPGTQYTVSKILQGQNSYDVKCHITTNNGRSCDSNIISVYVLPDPCN